MMDIAAAFVGRILERYVQAGAMSAVVTALVVTAALLVLADVAASLAPGGGTMTMAPWRW